MSAQISNVTDANFDTDVLASSLPVLVDFWAAWCGPCRAIAPILEEIAVSHGAKLKIVKLNVDENRMTSVKYDIKSIPTLLIFKNGHLEGRQIGLVTKAQLISFIDNYV